MEALLAGVKPADAVTFASAVGLCVLMTLAGSVTPTLRALRVISDHRDPRGVADLSTHFGIRLPNKHGGRLGLGVGSCEASFWS